MKMEHNEGRPHTHTHTHTCVLNTQIVSSEYLTTALLYFFKHLNRSHHVRLKCVRSSKRFKLTEGEKKKPDVTWFQCGRCVSLKVIFPSCTVQVIEIVNWLKGKTGCGLSAPLILLQVCQSHAIKCIASIVLVLINKWQRRQCVAMCTWGQGLIALFQLLLFSFSLHLSFSNFHSHLFPFSIFPSQSSPPLSK